MKKRCCSKGLLITGNGAGVGKCFHGVGVWNTSAQKKERKSAELA